MKPDCDDLVSRYWQAVKSALQDPQSDLIVEELSSAMRLELMEQEEELGRDLTEEEVVARLKAEKHPLVVAAEQGPQRCLIGPLLYPHYLRMLKWIGLGSLTWLSLWVCFAIFVPSSRLIPAGPQLISALRPVWEFAIYSFGIATAIFALLDRHQARVVGAWDPRKLPLLRNADQIPRLFSLAGLILNGALFLWWAGILPVPVVAGWNASLSPEVSRLFFWPILALLLILVMGHATSLAWPCRTLPIAGIRLCVDALGGIVILLFMLTGFRLPPFVEVHSGLFSPAEAAIASHLLTMAALSAMMAAEVLLAYGIYQNGRRLFGKEVRNIAS